MRESAAVPVLESIDLAVNVRYEPLPAFSPNDGRVISQSPVADLEVDLGTTVTIVVGQAEDPEGVDVEDPEGAVVEDPEGAVVEDPSG